MNFLSRLLRDVKGVGCKIEKDWKRGGYGWRIIVDGKSTDETPPDWESPFTALDYLPYDLKVNQAEDRIEIYVPKGDTLPDEEVPGTTAGMLYLNGAEVTAYDATTLGAISASRWWNVGGTLPTEGNIIQVWAYLKLQADLSSVDLTSPSAVMLAFSSTASVPTTDGWQKAWPIGIVSNTDDVYTITQLWHGERNIDPRFTDAESAALLGANDLHDTQSIDTQTAGGEHSLTLYGFKTGASISPAPANLTGIKLLVRKVVTGVTKLLYLDGPDLQSIIETIAEGVTPTTPGGFNTSTSADNRRHYNLSSLTDKDDHCGNRTAVLGTTTKGLYIHPDGNYTRNAMAGQIGDAFGVLVATPNLKTLFDGAATPKESVVWGDTADPATTGRRLYDSKGIAGDGLALDWEEREAYEPDGETVSLDWNAQQAAIADVPTGGSATAADNATAINSILAALRAYKIIAASA
jgi:hypothetical protein